MEWISSILKQHTLHGKQTIFSQQIGHGHDILDVDQVGHVK